MFRGFFLSLSLSFSRPYLHIKTSMWELLAHWVYSVHKGVFYCELPLIITRSPRRDPLRGGPVLPRPSLCHSPFVVVAVCCFGCMKERRRRRQPSGQVVSFSNVYLFLMPSGRSDVRPQDVLCKEPMGACVCCLPPLRAPRSVHECAPVKIDLLKGQQPLNLLPQEAFSTPQGDGTPRNTGWCGDGGDKRAAHNRGADSAERERDTAYRMDRQTDSEEAGEEARLLFFGCPPHFFFFFLRTLFWHRVFKAARQQLECHFCKPSKLRWSPSGGGND